MSVDNSSGFSWSLRRVHMGIAVKKTTVPLLVPNVDFQEPPKPKAEAISDGSKKSLEADLPGPVAVLSGDAQEQIDVRTEKFSKLLSSPTVDLGLSVKVQNLR